MRRKGIVMVVWLGLIAFLLSNCATIVSKSQYPVSLQSNPSGAEVIITDLKTGREVFRGTTPCVVTLSAKAGYFVPAEYSITFKKLGYGTRTITITASLDGWYIGNLFFGGLLGFLIIDPLTGAMWKLPENVNVTLPEITGDDVFLEINGKRLHIVFYEDLPKELKGKLVRIK